MYDERCHWELLLDVFYIVCNHCALCFHWMILMYEIENEEEKLHFDFKGQSGCVARIYECIMIVEEKYKELQT